jgi:D-xylonolactonase
VSSPRHPFRRERAVKTLLPLPASPRLDLLATGYGLIEGPVWDRARGLVFSDVLNGGVYCLDRSGRVGVVVEHRRGIGGIALSEDGGLIVSGRNIAYKGPAAPDTVVLLDRDQQLGIVGFNDLTTDVRGRIYVGSLCSSPFDPSQQRSPTPGWLHVIDIDGSSRRIADGVLLSNGLGFSPDGARLYHSDSRANIVGVYDVRSDGSVGPRRMLARVEEGIPDGLAVSEDGAVWVAAARGSAVVVFEPDGRERERIRCPLPVVTSVCFGGDDLRDLYIVTGAEGAGRPDAGSVFKLRVAIPGLRVPPALVKLP